MRTEKREVRIEARTPAGTPLAGVRPWDLTEADTARAWLANAIEGGRYGPDVDLYVVDQTTITDVRRLNEPKSKLERARLRAIK